jgi:hypothetical protein
VGLGTGIDMGISYLGGDRDNFSEIVIQTDAHEGSPSISPDQKWVAYSSGETELDHVYVTAFPSFEGKIPISVELGAEIVWAPDGTALYYRNGSKMMRVPVELDPTFQPGNPQAIWDHQYFFTELHNTVYDIHPDGDRFLMIKELAEGAVIEKDDVIVVENFFEKLKRIAPTWE